MRNRPVHTVSALSIAAIVFVGYGLSVVGQVSQESMKTLRYEKVTFLVPKGEIIVVQGQPMFISLCRPVALPGVPVSLVNPARGNSMLGAGVCGMTNMPGSTVNPSGGNPPYHFETEFSFEPFGLHLNNTTGFISGRPTQPGRRRFKVCAFDASGNKSDCQEIRIRVIKKEDQKKKKNSKDQNADTQNADAGNAEPVDATPPPDKWAHPASASAKVIGGIAAGVGGGLGGYYLSDYLSKQLDSSSSSSSSSSGSGGSSGGSSGSLTITGVSTIICRTAGAGHNCVGTMTVRTDSSSLSGVSITARASPSSIFFHGTLASVGNSATLSTPTPNGSGTLSTCTNQTSVEFIRNDNSVIVATKSQTISVSCQ